MRLYLRPEERRPDPEPLRTDDRKAVLVGMAVWGVLLVVALARREDLRAAGNGWWLWVCIAGLLLGGAGLAYLHRRAVRGNPPR